jgi:hypothetical protein
MQAENIFSHAGRQNVAGGRPGNLKKILFIHN